MIIRRYEPVIIIIIGLQTHEHLSSELATWTPDFTRWTGEFVRWDILVGRVTILAKPHVARLTSAWGATRIDGQGGSREICHDAVSHITVPLHVHVADRESLSKVTGSTTATVARITLPGLTGERPRGQATGAHIAALPVHYRKALGVGVCEPPLTYPCRTTVLGLPGIREFTLSYLAQPFSG